MYVLPMLFLQAPTVIIDSVTREHRGDYKCIAENIAGKDVRRIYLNVKCKLGFTSIQSTCVHATII